MKAIVTAVGNYPLYKQYSICSLTFRLIMTIQFIEAGLMSIAASASTDFLNLDWGTLWDPLLLEVQLAPGKACQHKFLI